MMHWPTITTPTAWWITTLAGLAVLPCMAVLPQTGDWQHWLLWGYCTAIPVLLGVTHQGITPPPYKPPPPPTPSER